MQESDSDLLWLEECLHYGLRFFNVDRFAGENIDVRISVLIYEMPCDRARLDQLHQRFAALMHCVAGAALDL